MKIFILFISVYVIAVNLYAFLLIKDLKDDYDERSPNKKYDGKLIITGLLGGALTLYICMFIFKYRIRSLFLMLLLPIISAMNIYVFIILLRSGFTFLVI